MVERASLSPKPFVEGLSQSRLSPFFIKIEPFPRLNRQRIMMKHSTSFKQLRHRSAFAFLLLGTSLGWLNSYAEPPRPEAFQIEVHKDKTRAHKPYYVQGRIVIEAPRERVWEILVDCGASEDIVPQIKSCRVEEIGDGWDVRRHRLSAGLFSVTAGLRAEYQYLQSVSMQRVSGGMRVHDGTWKLKPLPGDRTELYYEAWSKPDFWVPDQFIRNMIEKDAPLVLANLQARAEAAMQGQNQSPFLISKTVDRTTS